VPSKRRRNVAIVPLPSKAADAGMLIADATGRYSDARLEYVDGQLVVTSAKEAGQ
jgi:hypothetical protein